MIKSKINKNIKSKNNENIDALPVSQRSNSNESNRLQIKKLKSWKQTYLNVNEESGHGNYGYDKKRGGVHNAPNTRHQAHNNIA